MAYVVSKEPAKFRRTAEEERQSSPLLVWEATASENRRRHLSPACTAASFMRSENFSRCGGPFQTDRRPAAQVVMTRHAPRPQGA